MNGYKGGVFCDAAFSMSLLDGLIKLNVKMKLHNVAKAPGPKQKNYKSMKNDQNTNLDSGFQAIAVQSIGPLYLNLQRLWLTDSRVTRVGA